MSFFSVYKPGQGKWIRSLTFAGIMLVVLWGAKVLSDKLVMLSPYARYGIPAAVIVVLGIIAFWLVNREKHADFLIATEGEMKKVSWSNKKEVFGSTKVVIVTTVILALLLFAVDILFTVFFKQMGV